ncbi:Retrovirus-related Pol polyprotein from transposon TNT 1-94 [Nymphaea thermarum]|nr:Retrovirus-related Pol polyprotein from transposon TNT 1-94 [Nymphaea thermarum]
MASSFSSFPAPQWNAISALVSIKLNGDNYLHWKSQMESVMESQDLLEYVDGTNLAPSEIISTNGKTSSNPEYKQWRKSDRLALSWIKATVSDSVLGHIVRASSAREAWIILEKAYGSQSPLRVMLLRKELHFIRKRSMSMRTYLEKIRFLADTLSAAGQQTIDSDLVQITMNGLPAEYESFITLFTAGTHQSVITFAELVDLLLNQEKRLDLLKSERETSQNMTQLTIEFQIRLEETENPTSPNISY